MLTKKQRDRLKIGDLVLWADHLYRVRGFSDARWLCYLSGIEDGSFQFVEPAITSNNLEMPPPARVLAYKLSQ